MASLVTYEEVLKMRKLQSKGVSLRTIAHLMGRSRDTVARYVCKGCQDDSVRHNQKCLRARDA